MHTSYICIQGPILSRILESNVDLDTFVTNGFMSTVGSAYRFLAGTACLVNFANRSWTWKRSGLFSNFFGHFVEHWDRRQPCSWLNRRALSVTILALRWNWAWRVDVQGLKISLCFPSDSYSTNIISTQLPNRTYNWFTFLHHTTTTFCCHIWLA